MLTSAIVIYNLIMAMDIVNKTIVYYSFLLDTHPTLIDTSGWLINKLTTVVS